MNKRIRSAILALTAAGLTVTAFTFGATTASAGTVTTFTLTGGALSISAPSTASLGTGSAGSTLSASLGSVTVSDSRGLVVATWTATASTTAFTTGGGTPAETIAASNVSYASGLATAQTGLSVVLLPGQLTTLLAAPMTSPVTAFSLTAGVGNNSASWNPTILVNAPASAVAGTYTGTITHSVA
jgi:hypothetical protein